MSVWSFSNVLRLLLLNNFPTPSFIGARPFDHSLLLERSDTDVYSRLSYAKQRRQPRYGNLGILPHRRKNTLPVIIQTKRFRFIARFIVQRVDPIKGDGNRNSVLAKFVKASPLNRRRLQRRPVPRRDGLLLVLCIKRQRDADQNRDADENRGRRLLTFSAVARVLGGLDERSARSAKERKRGKDREILGKDEDGGFFIVEKRKMHAEEKIFRNAILDKKPKSNA